MAKTREYQALLYACQQEGCPICRLTQESIARYLDNWKYELFTDVELRDELRRAQGFCHAHTWQLARLGATLQLAQAYREIISDTIDQLQQDLNTPTAGGLWHRLKEGMKDTVQTPGCPACRQQAQAEERYAHSLRQALLEPGFYDTFSTSHGLCLEHFRLTCELKLTVPGAWLSLLRQAQFTCLQRLDQQLGELIRKHDYRFQDEVRGEEMISWKRAAGLVAGENDRP